MITAQALQQIQLSSRQKIMLEIRKQISRDRIRHKHKIFKKHEIYSIHKKRQRPGITGSLAHPIHLGSSEPYII